MANIKDIVRKAIEIECERIQMSHIAIVGELRTVNTAAIGKYLKFELALFNTAINIVPDVVTKINWSTTMIRSLGQRVNGIVTPYPL